MIGDSANLRQLAKPRLQSIEPCALVVAECGRVPPWDGRVTMTRDRSAIARWTRETRGPSCAILALDRYGDARDVLEVLRGALRWLPVILLGERHRGASDDRGPADLLLRLPHGAPLPGVVRALDQQLLARFSRAVEYCHARRFQPQQSEIFWRLDLGVPHTSLPAVLKPNKDTIRKELGKMRRQAQVEFHDDMVAAANGGRLYEPFPAIPSLALASGFR